MLDALVASIQALKTHLLTLLIHKEQYMGTSALCWSLVWDVRNIRLLGYCHYVYPPELRLGGHIDHRKRHLGANGHLEIE